MTEPDTSHVHLCRGRTAAVTDLASSLFCLQVSLFSDGAGAHGVGVAPQTYTRSGGLADMPPLPESMSPPPDICPLKARSVTHCAWEHYMCVPLLPATGRGCRSPPGSQSPRHLLSHGFAGAALQQPVRGLSFADRRVLETGAPWHVPSGPLKKLMTESHGMILGF